MLAALAYPTVVLTVALGVCVVYWAFVFLGALDVNLLGAGEGATHGAGDGALEGATKGVVEGVAGASKGAAEGVAGTSKGAAESVAGTSKPRRAPVTVTVSVHLALAWLVCVLLVPFLGALGAGGVGPRLAQTALLLGALAVTQPLASIVVAPLAPLFSLRKARTHGDLVGRVCTITTGSVDARFGQAELRDGGAGLLLHVRNDGGGLRRGDEALIVAWDESRESFLVEPMASVLAAAPSRARVAPGGQEASQDRDVEGTTDTTAAKEPAAPGRRET